MFAMIITGGAMCVDIKNRGMTLLTFCMSHCDVCLIPMCVLLL